MVEGVRFALAPCLLAMPENDGKLDLASLRTLDHPTQLHLSGAIMSHAVVRFGHVAVSPLLHALESVSTLRNVALESLAPRIVHPPPALQALTSLTLMYHVKLSATAAREMTWLLCARLILLQNLRRLHVPSVVPSSMMKDLATAVAELPELTYLGLHQNHFLDNAVVVTDLLRCGSVQLRHLELSGEGSDERKYQTRAWLR